MDIQISAQGAVGPNKQELCRLSTNVTAPPDHPVILGMTPIDSKPSLFVVQVLDVKPVGGAAVNAKNRR